MDMNDLKDWAGRAAAGPPLTPDEGAVAPEAAPEDPHECSARLRALGDAAKAFMSDLKTAVEQVGEHHIDADLKKVEDLVAALETGGDDLLEAASAVEELENAAAEEEDDESDDEESDDEDGPPGSA